MAFARETRTHLYHANSIAMICQITGCEKYLELGTQDGFTVKIVAEVVPYCVGVDINPCSFNGTMFVGTTDDFFEQNRETFDVIFIDADHAFSSVVKDLENALGILNKHGIIFMHDTDPVSPEFAVPGYCDDCYKIVDYIYAKHPELDIVTLPAREAGLSIVCRKADRRMLNIARAPEESTP